MSASAPLQLTSEAFAQQLEVELLSIDEVPSSPAFREAALQALARLLRDAVQHSLALQGQRVPRGKQVYYLSMEYLPGRLLLQYLQNLELTRAADAILQSHGLTVTALLEEEEEPALGNGGLGRLAACFLDSAAALAMPVMGYGMMYEYGAFRQLIVAGEQEELPNPWLERAPSWCLRRSQRRYRIGFGGTVEGDSNSPSGHRWVPARTVLAAADDLLLPGPRAENICTLRLWSAASDSLRPRPPHDHDYLATIHAQVEGNELLRVLLPDDINLPDPTIRLLQQYFFASATAQDTIRRHLLLHGTLASLPQAAVFHLNDTQTVLVALELLRLLHDEHGFGFMEAWELVRSATVYTNHTVLKERLERWSPETLAEVNPRLLELVYELNARFLEKLRREFPRNEALVQGASIFQETPDKRLRMAHLGTLLARSTNGVSLLHERTMRQGAFRELAQLHSDRFSGLTNGVSHRRWLSLCNPHLDGLIGEALGPRWAQEPERLQELLDFATDPAFCEKFREVKRANHQALADFLKREHDMSLPLDTFLVVQTKRVHEYKRQVLSLFHILLEFEALRDGRSTLKEPTTFVFAGRAAPTYQLAKDLIALTHSLARLVASDARARDLLRVIFIPDYRVRVAERVIPAADLSEHLSLAGTEASGTSNMKYALNGAVALCSLDGSNIELQGTVGAENIFSFGLAAPEVEGLRARGYAPSDLLSTDPQLRHLVDELRGTLLGSAPEGRFAALAHSLATVDPFFVLADLPSYLEAQRLAQTAHGDVLQWTRRAIAHVAGAGAFTSDFVVRRYADRVWMLPR